MNGVLIHIGKFEFYLEGNEINQGILYSRLQFGGAGNFLVCDE